MLSLQGNIEYYIPSIFFVGNIRQSSKRKRVQEEFYKHFTEEEKWTCDERMKRRRKRVEEVCEQLTASGGHINSTINDYLRKGPKLGNIWVNAPRKLAVCIPHKVGSQMWRYFFHKLDKKDSGISENESRIQFQTEIPNDIADYYISFQTRHPLERLLSSYRFMFEREQMRTNVIEIIKHIFRLFPFKSDVEQREFVENNGGISFKEIKLSNKVEHTNINSDEDEMNWYKITPSFKQFVLYISDINASGADFEVSKSPAVNHWMPYYTSCNPCFNGE